MAFHPRDRWPWNRQMTRREMLRVTAGSIVAAQFLAACGGNGSGGTSASGIVIGTPQNPVQQPYFDDNPMIDSGLEPEAGPLRLYNWDDYIWRPVIKDFEKEYGVEVELKTFYNLEEATRKLRTGEVQYDVFFPTAEIIPKFVAGKLFQPLNLDYLPNLEKNVLPRLVDPYYDQGSRYTVPYVVYHTGIGWRVDMVPDDIAAMDNPWDVFWNPDYKDICRALRRLPGVDRRRDVQERHQQHQRGEPRRTRDGQEQPDRAGRPGERSLHDRRRVRQDARGQVRHPSLVVGRPGGRAVLLPQGRRAPTCFATCGPRRRTSDAGGYISNDSMAVFKGAENPVLAHHFLDFMLSEKYGLKNFSWLGYQPPLKSLDPATLVKDGWVSEDLATATVVGGGLSLGQSSRPAVRRGGRGLAGGLVAGAGREASWQPARGSRRRAALALASVRRPGVLWLVLFFLVPFYAILAVAMGRLDPIFASAEPVWNPLDWDPRRSESVFERFRSRVSSATSSSGRSPL